LPLHLTDYVHERLMNFGDATLTAFLDLFHHRLLSLFYRAWAQAQPTVNLDRRKDDRFADFIGSLIGIGSPRLRQRDAVGDSVKLFHAGQLARQVRNADGLHAIVASYFRVLVRIEESVGHWMHLPTSERSRLGRFGSSSQLGRGTVAGSRVWDRQHKFRIHIGPLDLVAYEDFLPGGHALPRLVALVRQYLCFELDWDLRLALAHDHQPQIRLGRSGRLGWTTWLGRARDAHDPNDLVLEAEAVLARHRRATPAPVAA
jgi:type VI secretion system protein ImpH